MKEVKIGNLKVSAEQLMNVWENFADHISVVDKNFNVLWGNKFAKANFGEKLIGMKCYEAYHGRNEKCPDCLVEKTYKDGKIHEHETMVVPKNGEPVYFHCNAYILKWGKDKKPEVVVEISKVITDRVKLEKDIKQLARLTNEREAKMLEQKDKIKELEKKANKK